MASKSGCGGGGDCLDDEDIDDLLDSFSDVDDDDIDPDFVLSNDENSSEGENVNENSESENENVGLVENEFEEDIMADDPEPGRPEPRRRRCGRRPRSPLVAQPDDVWDVWGDDTPNFDLTEFSSENCGFIPPPNQPRPTTPLQFFMMFFTFELFQEIANETNRYIKEKISKITPLRKNSIWWDWKDVTANEIMVFHGVLLNMGRQAKTTLKDFFSDNWVDSSNFFKDVFSRKRYLQIFWALHVSPPARNAQGMQSRASKLRNVLDYVGSKFLELYRPNQFLSADESTVSFKGRVAFKMYNPKKPVKWGLRLYVLADSLNGYICNMIPYYGSLTTNNLIRPDLPFTTRIIYQLAVNLQNVTQQTGYVFYTDRLYTSLDLALELKNMGIYLTGTLDLKRKLLPKCMKKKVLKRLKKHAVIAFKHKTENVLALAWKDKRDVCLLSTNHNPETQLISRSIRKNVAETIPKPIAICDYTAKMGGVDRNDHYCTSYGFAKKSLKWWRKLYFWILEVSIVNSFILYNIDRQQNNLRPVLHSTYRKELIKGLVGEVRNLSRKRGRRHSAEGDDGVRLNGMYHSLQVQEGKKTKDCAVCSNRKVPGGRKETTFYCATCPCKPGLHPNTCFDKYHTVKKYKN